MGGLSAQPQTPLTKAREADSGATFSHSRSTQCPAGHASQGASAGLLRLDTRSHSMSAADSGCLP